MLKWRTSRTRTSVRWCEFLPRKVQSLNEAKLNGYIDNSSEMVHAEMFLRMKTAANCSFLADKLEKVTRGSVSMNPSTIHSTGGTSTARPSRASSYLMFQCNNSYMYTTSLVLKTRCTPLLTQNHLVFAHTSVDFHHLYVVAKHEVCTLTPFSRNCNKGHGLDTHEFLQN